jgi:hypothetical protein
VGMIQKHYNIFEPGYFRNFISVRDPEDIIKEALEPYKAKIVKSNTQSLWYELTINWHDEQLYTLFVLRWL